MLCGINQKSNGLSSEIRNEGCLFLCFAYVSPLLFAGEDGIKALNRIWNKAKKDKVISSENVILDHNKLAQDYFYSNLKYDGKHHDAAEVVPANVQCTFGQYFWKEGHFVIINNRKEVVFDPLVISNTVKNGKLKTMRFYYAI